MEINACPFNVKAMIAAILCSAGFSIPTFCQDGVPQPVAIETELRSKITEAKIKAASTESLAKWTSFKSSDGRLQLQYPSAWEKEALSAGQLLHFNTLKGVVNINASSEAVPPGMSSEKYNQLNLQGLKNYDPKAGLHFDVVSSKLRTTGKQSMYETTMNCSTKGLKVHQILLRGVSNSTGYAVTVSCLSVLLPDFEPVIEKISASVQLE